MSWVNVESEGSRDGLTAVHWRGRDIALTVLAAPPGSLLADVLARALVGRDVQPTEWAQLVGAPDGSTVRVATARKDLDGVRESVEIELSHPWLETPAVRFLSRDDGGRAWWEANGSEFRAYFNLAEGSVSRRLLAAYTREKGIVV